MDWTNNYGLRPFFPFSPRWHAGSFVFVFEPILFLFLLIGLVAPSLFGLISSEIGARRPTFRGQSWAIAALLSVVTLWTFRFIQHRKALEIAQTGDYNGLSVLRVAADPYPINAFHWQTVVETPQSYVISSANTFSNTIADQRTEPKLSTSRPLLSQHSLPNRVGSAKSISIGPSIPSSPKLTPIPMESQP